jgi:hypothetical protein
MWTIDQTQTGQTRTGQTRTGQQTSQHLTHDLPCSGCGHAVHTYLPCSDTCACAVTSLPGMLPLAA